MPNWTKDQELAINKDGSNIIVSAGAGSGKTAVLTQRVITKLEKGININNLLVLTFTNAAAAEMKDRIRKAIIKKGLTDQLDLLDSAYITTFDSYAQSIVRKYHYLLNIPSKVQIVHDTIIKIEINRIIDDIFENRYSSEKFKNLIKSYCFKDDKKIKKVVIDLNEKLDLKTNKIEFLDNYISNYYNDEFIDNVVKEYIDSIFEIKNEIKELFLDLKGYLTDKQYDNLYIYLSKLLESNTYDDIRNSFNNKSIRMINLDEEAKPIYEKIKENINYLKNDYSLSIDEVKSNLLSTKDNVEEIISLVKELDYRLNIFKKENNSYTFNDIAKMAIKIVKENTDVQDEIKNHFSEIMVDEYQDTSDIQDEFISLIGNNNIYMVGDIKQSIYRFRNANPDIFRNRYNDYSKNNGGIKIDLLKNFRSRGEVLDDINNVFDLIMDEKIGSADYKVSHRMIPGNSIYDLKNNYKYNMDLLTYNYEDKEYTNAEIEAFIIAKDIKEKVESKYQIIDKESNKLRDINYGDFCIIMDRGGDFDTYSKVFEYFNIPNVVWHDEKLNTEDDILVLKNIVNLIIKVKEEKFDQEFKYFFTSVARSYLFDYSDNQILDIFVNNKFKEDKLYKIAYDISLKIDSITNSELLDIIIKDFNIYEKSIVKGNIEECNIRYDIFSKLFTSLSDLGYTPYDLSEYFKNSADLEIKYSLNSKVDSSVNIMNIHKSKGLEFSICYFSGLKKKFNDEEIKSNFLFDDKYGIIIPVNNDGLENTILKKLFIKKYYKQDISEKIRLFYVALTRTKEKMIIVTPELTNENEIREIVDDNIRLNYRSLYDILNSINNKLNTYKKNITIDNLNLTKDYNLSKKEIPNIFTNDKEIKVNEIKIDSNILLDNHFSKETNTLRTKNEIDNMNYGTYMHYLFEVTDFKNPKTTNKQVLNFINKLDLNCNIYKEYEFMYEKDNINFHGVIDLMLVYDDHIDIIDYKLKDITDENYIKQLNGYKSYIENKMNKKTNTYLYSIFDESLLEI